ncbi:phage gp6-like head-tail connector protein [Brevundimonas sp. S30B]|uniref:head-tail connector protein n=1 Tax=unclassified Brevundimonas TaxID=2622653 RepID=UPI001071B636|nr:MULTISPECIES: head-tail connector protein [unclassified Brevundimonas]QBX37226.1 phage gp6-like head-tail connector protein [Brevundimonas sp. MF30-B]TFW03980.1 phage gp6-like head-tail connector protein [Brevundimonas sp. S30B]
MSLVSLEQAKANLRVTEANEDQFIRDLIEAAEAYIGRLTGRAFIDGEDHPSELRQAALLLIAMWFRNRLPVNTGNLSVTELPFGVNALLAPFRDINP